MPPASDRLRRTVDAYTTAVRKIRTLDTAYHEEEDEATFDAKLALLGLDTGLVCPRFCGLAILTYHPELAHAPGIVNLLDALEPIDALARTARIMETARREGPIATHEAAEALAGELRTWMEVGREIPEMRAALVAYRDDPRLLNEIRHGAEAI